MLAETFQNITDVIEFDRLVEISQNITRIALTFNNETLAGVEDLILSVSNTVFNLTEKVETLQDQVNELTKSPPLCSALTTAGGSDCSSLNSSMSSVNVNMSNVPALDLDEFKIKEVCK